MKWCSKAPNKGKMKMFSLAYVQQPPPPPWVNCWKSVKINQISHSNLGDAQKEKVFFGDSFPKLSKQAGRVKVWSLKGDEVTEDEDWEDEWAVEDEN